MRATLSKPCVGPKIAASKQPFQVEILNSSQGEIGNGRATAVLLARHGAKVALLDNNIEWVQETKRMIDAEGGVSEAIQTDVTDEESCKRAVARTVELFGAVHILVNIGKLSDRSASICICSKKDT